MKQTLAILWCLFWILGGWLLIFLTAMSIASPRLSPWIANARITFGALVPFTAFLTLGFILFKKYKQKTPIVLWKTLLPLHLVLLALVVSMSVGWG